MKLTGLLGRTKNIFVLASSAIFISSCAGGGGGSNSGNTLNVGYGTTAPNTVDLKPQFAGLMNYNSQPVNALMEMRSKNAGFHPELLKGAYKPNQSIFQFDGGNPWWGLKGYLFRGKDLNKTDGMSRESPYFGNPFILVAPEWYANNLQWADSRFSTAESFANVFPIFLQPTGLKVFPKDEREEITYKVMDYFNTVRSMANNDFSIKNIGFDLKAYNAEDFGYKYLYVDVTGSTGLGTLPPDVIPIEQTLMVRHKDTCAPACNDIDSPDALNGFKLNSLPAKCRILLWRNKPTSHLVQHDFTVDLIFN